MMEKGISFPLPAKGMIFDNNASLLVRLPDIVDKMMYQHG
jgi:hypothetical protein